MKKDLKTLRKERADKATRGKAALAEHQRLEALDARTDDQEARLTALGAEIDTLEADVSAIDGDIAALEAGQRRQLLFATTSDVRRYGQGGRANEPNPETTFGFKSIAEFAGAVRQAVVNQSVDPRLTGGGLDASQPTTFNVNQGSSGEGWTVPPDFSREIWSIAFEATDLFGMANPEPIMGNTIVKPKDETTPWGAVGVQAVWEAEGGVLTPSKAQLTGEVMKLQRLYAFVAATDEVLDDSSMLKNRLTIQAGRALKWKLSEAVMTGSGVGQPLGFMNAPSLITVAKDSGQAAKTFTLNNILGMAAHVLRIGTRPMWMANQDTIPQLGQLAYPNGFPAWLPYNQPLEGSPFEGNLLGYPLMFSEHGSTLGTPGDLTLMNLDGYYAANKDGGGLDFAQSIHLYFDSGMTAFRWTIRAAGLPYLSAPVAAAKGATSKSHFVVLAQRS